MKADWIVCFDLGGVLVQICRGLAEACERARVPFRDPEWMNGELALASRRDVMAAYQLGQLATEEYLQGMYQACEGRLSVSEMRRVHAAWLIRPYAKVDSLVRELNALPGVETACLSNTNALHWVTLTQAPPGPFSVVSELGHRFASHLLRSSKPDPGMYEALESSLGVAPERIVFFDDLGPNVEAARARGWRAWLVDHASETAPQMREALQREGILPSLRP